MDWTDGGVGPSYGSMDEEQQLINVDTSVDQPLMNRRLGGFTGKGFMPGRSGNPGGRPRNHVVQLARKHTDAAIAALAAALENPRERAAAAAILLDRGWGKASQQLELTGADGGPIQTQELPPDTRMTIDAFIAEWREVPAEEGGDNAAHQQDAGNAKGV